jgi:hypothetical protein
VVKNFTSGTLLETKVAVVLGEHFVRIVTKSQEGFCPEPPCKGWELVANGICDRMRRNEAGTLSKM